MAVGLSVESYRKSVQRFLDAVDFDVPFESPRQAVLDESLARLRCLPGWQEKEARCMRVAYGVVRLIIPYLCDKVQVEVTVFYALGVIIDDDPLRYMDGIVFHGGRLVESDHVGYHYAKGVFDAIEALSEWYEPFIISTLWRSFFQWMVFLPHETRHAKALASVRSMQFIDYMRQLLVVSDATSCVVFTKDIPWSEYIHHIPGMNLLVQEANDLLSSYKELIVGKDVCSVMIQRQKFRNKPIEEVIEESCDVCIETIKGLYSSPGSDELKMRLRQFVAGYVQFYLDVDRYRLKELLYGEARGEF
ncbi:uncharacterized protein UV8b_04627 [Ustilaginoidea virens]|uniref:Terpenoid synthase n=1 Tax=Ustilaginoidea virens TaxID=1159556 RepID=A0A063BZC2_USTVR|nr:uncharacterized protein UV8b_04627 [Ustilaginoidea virens]QUC20386.1 hypothetical protein UV8b_04627 [Ustilaginoidea virens]GAO14688.1 hypothetical protein UVI_02028970 [Ustilaginoidea virens]